MSKSKGDKSRRVYRLTRHIYHKAMFPKDDAAWAAKMWQEEDPNFKIAMRAVARWHLDEVAKLKGKDANGKSS